VGTKMGTHSAIFTDVAPIENARRRVSCAPKSAIFELR
jgi:hypothetical protein